MSVSESLAAEDAYSRRQQPREPQPTDTTFVSLRHDNWTFEALGYARGRSDGEDVPVAGASRWVNPPLAFARAYANQRENGQHAPDLRSAYDRWQDSTGISVL